MRKKKKKLKIVNNYATMILVFLLAIGVGALGRQALTMSDGVELRKIVVEVKRDSLPLENGGKVIIEKIGNEKSVYLSFEDLQYISTRKAKMRKLVENLEGLFSRMEE